MSEKELMLLLSSSLKDTVPSNGSRRNSAKSESSEKFHGEDLQSTFGTRKRKRVATNQQRVQDEIAELDFPSSPFSSPEKENNKNRKEPIPSGNESKTHEAKKDRSLKEKEKILQKEDKDEERKKKKKKSEDEEKEADEEEDEEEQEVPKKPLECLEKDINDTDEGPVPGLTEPLGPVEIDERIPLLQPKLKKNQRLLAKDPYGDWYYAYILRVEPKKCRVAYMGWPKEHNEWIPKHKRRLRALPTGPLKVDESRDDKMGQVNVGDDILALDKSSNLWYQVKVVAIKATKNKLKVSYSGWGPAFDEWIKISSSRLRPISHAQHSLTLIVPTEEDKDALNNEVASEQQKDKKEEEANKDQKSASKGKELENVKAQKDNILVSKASDQEKNSKPATQASEKKKGDKNVDKARDQEKDSQSQPITKEKRKIEFKAKQGCHDTNGESKSNKNSSEPRPSHSQDKDQKNSEPNAKDFNDTNGESKFKISVDERSYSKEPNDTNLDSKSANKSADERPTRSAEEIKKALQALQLQLEDIPLSVRKKTTADTLKLVSQCFQRNIYPDMRDVKKAIDNFSLAQNATFELKSGGDTRYFYCANNKDKSKRKCNACIPLKRMRKEVLEGQVGFFWEIFWTSKALQFEHTKECRGLLDLKPVTKAKDQKPVITKDSSKECLTPIKVAPDNNERLSHHANVKKIARPVGKDNQAPHHPNTQRPAETTSISQGRQCTSSTVENNVNLEDTKKNASCQVKIMKGATEMQKVNQVKRLERVLEKKTDSIQEIKAERKIPPTSSGGQAKQPTTVGSSKEIGKPLSGGTNDLNPSLHASLYTSQDLLKMSTSKANTIQLPEGRNSMKTLPPNNLPKRPVNAETEIVINKRMRGIEGYQKPEIKHVSHMRKPVQKNGKIGMATAAQVLLSAARVQSRDSPQTQPMKLNKLPDHLRKRKSVDVGGPLILKSDLIRYPEDKDLLFGGNYNIYGVGDSLSLTDVVRIKHNSSIGIIPDMSKFTIKDYRTKISACNNNKRRKVVSPQTRPMVSEITGLEGSSVDMLEKLKKASRLVNDQLAKEGKRSPQTSPNQLFHPWRKRRTSDSSLPPHLGDGISFITSR